MKKKKQRTKPKQNVHTDGGVCVLERQHLFVRFACGRWPLFFRSGEGVFVSGGFLCYIYIYNWPYTHMHKNTHSQIQKRIPCFALLPVTIYYIDSSHRATKSVGVCLSIQSYIWETTSPPPRMMHATLPTPVSLGLWITQRGRESVSDFSRDPCLTSWFYVPTPQRCFTSKSSIPIWSPPKKSDRSTFGCNKNGLARLSHDGAIAARFR